MSVLEALTALHPPASSDPASGARLSTGGQEHGGDKATVAVRGALRLTPGIARRCRVIGDHSLHRTELTELDIRYVANGLLWEDMSPLVETGGLLVSGRGV